MSPLPDPKTLRGAYALAVYKFGVACYRFGLPLFADLFFRLFLAATGQFDLVSSRATNGCPNPRSYAAFARDFSAFLDERWLAWSGGRVEQPPYVRAQTAPAPLERLRTERVLMITPRYLMASDRYLENDFIDHAYRSLENAGVAAELFDGGGICYPDLIHLDPGRARQDLGELGRIVERFRPTVIFFDANFVGRPGSLDATFLADMKTRFGAKLIAFVGDAWGEYGKSAVDYWAPNVDLVWHVVPELDREAGYPANLLCAPYPVNERNFYRETVRDGDDLTFFGSRQTYLRAFWLARAKRDARRLALQSNIRAGRRTSDAPSMQEYAAIMRHSRMVLNLSMRNPTTKIITGRVWQALHSGVLLLEEENAATRNFFVPFVHYAPFENARQLDYMIAFFKQNDGWRERIGEAVAQFCAEQYSAASIWARVFDRLDNS